MTKPNAGWVLVLLAVTSTLSCLAYVTATVTVTRSEFTWPADRVGDPAPLVLSAQSPESLTVEGPCFAAAQTQASDLLTTGDPGGNSLTLRAQDGRVWMTYAGAQIGRILAAGTDCAIKAAYSRSDNVARLTVGEASSEAVLEPPRVGYDSPPYSQIAVTHVWAHPGFAASVITQPTTYSSSAWRVLWLAMGAGSLLLMGRALRQGSPAARRPPARPLWSAQDSLVSAVGALALLVVPPRFDDGWVLTTVRQYGDLGFFSNYYSVEAAAQPQGFWWTWIERLWLVPTWTPGFLLRLPSILLVVAAWWLIRRHVLHRVRVGPAATWTAAVVACVGLVGLQVTIRPEPLVAMLVAAAISVVLRYSSTREPWLLVILGFLTALGLSAHQTGWAVAGAAVSVLPWAWDWVRGNRVAAASVAIASAALAAQFLMLGSNATLWLRSVDAFRRDTTTYQALFDEGERIAALATRFDIPPATIVAGAFLALSVAGFLVRSDRLDSGAKAAGWAAVASIGGLLLTTSKLVDHYGAVVPAAGVLAGLAVANVTRRAVGALAAASVVVAFVAFSGDAVWTLALERASVLQLGVWRPLALGAVFLVALVAALAVTRDRAVPSGIALVVVAGTGAVALLLSLVPVVVDGVTHRGSWLGQQIAALRGQRCGLVDTVPVSSPAVSAFESARTSGGGLEKVEVPSTGGAWARGPLFSPLVLEVESSSGLRTISMPPSSSAWSSLPLPTDQSAVLRWSTAGVSVAAPSVVRSQSAREWVASGDPWWVEPGLALQAPCVKSASIAEGTVPQVEYSVGRPGWVGSGLFDASRSVFDAGCAGGDGSGQCLVRIVAERRIPLESTQSLERVQ